MKGLLRGVCYGRYVKKVNKEKGNVFNMKEKVFDKIVKEERLLMKKRLLRWGKAIDFCQKKQREVIKLQNMAKQFLILGENAPFLEKENVSLKEAEELYKKEIDNIVKYMKREMEQYSIMERYIEQLDYDEQIFLKMRYEKEYQYDYIALKMHKSRAKCFRDHDVILDKLIMLCKEKEIAA